MVDPDSVILTTPRLDLVAAALPHVCAELQSPERLAAMLGAEVDAGWPPGEYDRGAQEYFRDRLQQEGPAAVGWYGWYALLRNEDSRPPILVGAGGYLGPPNERGEVEIGFSIMPDRRQKGYATELVEALAVRACKDPRVTKIIAHTSPQNTASCEVLAKTGFQCVCEEEPGVWRLSERPGKTV